MNGRVRLRWAMTAILAGGVVLLGLSFLLAQFNRRDTVRRELDSRLAMAASTNAETVESTFARARVINLILAQNPVFADFYGLPGTREERLRRNPRMVARLNAALAGLETLHKGEIAEACFIDRSGGENARVTRGHAAPLASLSADESGSSFFARTFATAAGSAYQARPYVSPDTGEWVVSNSSVITAPDGSHPGMVHYEITLESFRRSILLDHGVTLRLVDAMTGDVIADSRHPQKLGATLGVPGDSSMRRLQSEPRLGGQMTAGGTRIVFRRVKTGQGNANDWFVVASAPVPGLIDAGGFGAQGLATILGGILLIGVALFGLRRYQRELRRLALQDELTGLPNRRAVRERLDTIGRRRAGGLVALLLLDLDRFKDVNDTIGHAEGDELIRRISAMLSGAVRDTDLMARVGGDEFAVILTNIASAGDAEAAAERLLAALSEPVEIRGEDLSVQVDASIGIALSADVGAEAEVLVQRAEIAMYEAKKSQRRLLVYSEQIDKFSRRRLRMVPALRTAIERREIELWYQPKIDLRTGRADAAEALARWNSAEFGGRVPPSDFVQVAEDTGLIFPLTELVLDKAVEQVRQWLDVGLRMVVSVNISPRNLLAPDFPRQVRACLVHHGVPPELIHLEITENGIIEDTEGAIAALAKLSELGIGLSLDDFGTGYSNLGHLKRLPLTELKIDRGFVMNMVFDRSDAAIVRSVIELGHNLKLTVVAEGVEDEAARDVLLSLGCDVAQGFLYARPLPAEGFVTWLLEGGHADPSVVPVGAADGDPRQV